MKQILPGEVKRWAELYLGSPCGTALGQNEPAPDVASVWAGPAQLHDGQMPETDIYDVQIHLMELDAWFKTKYSGLDYFGIGDGPGGSSKIHKMIKALQTLPILLWDSRREFGRAK